MKMCYKSSFPLVNRVLQKSVQIHAQKQPESASMGRESDEGEGESKNLGTFEDHD
jgi:hypothetical protein